MDADAKSGCHLGDGVPAFGDLLNCFDLEFFGVSIPAPLARLNSSTFGQVKFPQAGQRRL
jgi:hypothetical protein